MPVTGDRPRRLTASTVVLVAVLVAMLVAVPRASADTTVNVTTTNGLSTPGDGLCSLPEAVAYADGTAEPDCAPGTANGRTTINLPANASKYTVPGVLALNRDATINGGGATGTIIDGGGTTQVVNIAASTNVTISGVTVTGGLTSTDTAGCSGSGVSRSCPAEPGLPGGGIANAGTLTLKNSALTGNATRSGAREFTGGFILGCFFFMGSFSCPASAGRSAGGGGDGGGIDNTGQLTVVDSVITNNTAGNGGSGTDGFSGSGGSTAPGQNGGFGGAGGNGGGLYNASGATATISNTTIAGNGAGSGGNAGAGSNTTDGSNSNGGSAGYPGGGGSGGGIYNAGTLTITGSTISGNKTGTGGDGATGGSPQGTGSPGYSSYSSSGGSGGGLLNVSSQTVTMSNDTVASNNTSAGGTGGAGAGSAGLGGGILHEGLGLVQLTFVTVARNQSVGTGGGLDRASVGPLTETDTIVAANTGPPANNCAGSVTDNGANLVFGDNSCPGITGDPKLGTLVSTTPNNGGPTPTMSLGPGSAAIDKAPCAPTVDQRGVSRPQGSQCDIGAYEVAPPTVTGASATGASPTSGTVSAAVNPNLQATHVTIEYGVSPAYGSSTAQDVGNGDAPVPLAVALSGLAPATTYHFRITASNADGVTSTADGTFATPALPPPPPPLVAALSDASTSGPTARLSFTCTGVGGANTCSGPVTITVHVTTQGGRVVALATAKKKRRPRKPKRQARPKPKVTTVVTVATGTYSVPSGASVVVTIPLNKTGQSLLTQRYTLPATVTVGGTTALTRTVTFTYPRITSPVSFTWAFSPGGTVARELTVSAVPSPGTVAVICRGGGCPFARRAYPLARGGRIALATKLRRSRLRPGTTLELDITSPNRVGKVAIFKMKRNDQPSLQERCLPPGARRPAPCV